jgi:soluble cytochrome b562
MKKAFFFAAITILMISCNNKGETTTSTADTTKTTVSDSKDLVYPYTLEEPYKDWQPGDKQHAVTVMKSLKAFETGDVDGAVAAFGDSVDLRFDYFHAKLSNDSLKKFFTAERAKYSSITIKMGDWESVISSDKKTEYVTLWYKQIWTDTKGKIDSIGVIDDAKIVNGKIVELDEKIQHYPAKK